MGFDKPRRRRRPRDTYVSDPGKARAVHPAPGALRRFRPLEDTGWSPISAPWPTGPDVLTYQTPVLTAPVRISGAPIADLFAATTGTDADWVVKLIDVYPDEVPSQPEMGGYQLAVSMDIFRGRYRESFEHPSAIPAGKPQRYRFVLPTTNHVFLPGHRIMVQIQSSWFPLYDRNPQTYVPNIFFAKPADYVKATQSVFRSRDHASAVWLPVVP